MPQRTEERNAGEPFNQTDRALRKSTGSSGRFHDDDTSRFAVTIAATPETVFAFFRDFARLPSFMKGLKEVQVVSSTRSHWIVELENGLRAEWDAEITAERPNQMIQWQSVEGSQVETSGSIWFSPAPEDQGTVVGLNLQYKVPGGKLTELLTKVTLEDPDSIAYLNLKRLKALLETGEIPTIEGQPSGRDADAETITTH